MSNIYISFILTIIAGFSTIIGYFSIYIKNNNIIIKSLSFSSSVMLFISLFDLIPQTYILLNNTIKIIPLLLIILISINIGIIISLLIKDSIPISNDVLYKVGIISMISIIIHNIPEGMATFISTNTNINLGIKLTIAITLHNIPEGISIAIPIYYSTKSKLKAFVYTALSGMSELIGALIAYLFIKPSNIMLGILFSIIAGIMIHISIKELLFTALSYNKRKYTYIYFIIGLIFIILYKIVIE